MNLFFRIVKGMEEHVLFENFSNLYFQDIFTEKYIQKES